MKKKDRIMGLSTGLKKLSFYYRDISAQTISIDKYANLLNVVVIEEQALSHAI